MSVVYKCDLTTPETPRDQLHDYHGDINDLVDVDVIGVTGDSSKIRRIVLSETTDVSNLEDWLGESLTEE